MAHLTDLLVTYGFTAISSTGGFTVFRNEGSLNFTKQLTFPMDIETQAIVVGNFDANAGIDVVTGSALQFGNDGLYSFRSGLGGGDFGPKSSGVAPGRPFAAQLIAALDIDGDGLLDFSSSDPISAPAVYYGVGNGVFLPNDSVSTLDGGYGGFVDLDGAGAAEVVRLGESSLEVQSATARNYGPPSQSLVATARAFAMRMNAGVEELLIAVGNSVVVMAGGQALQTHPVPGEARRIRAAAGAVIVSDFTPGTGGVFLGDGDLTSFTIPISVPVNDATLAFLDGDLFPDLVAAVDPANAFLQVMWGTGPGTFDPVPVVFTAVTASRVTAADLDGDARDEIIATDSLLNSIVVMHTDATRNFTTSAVIPVGDGPLDPLVADVDQDGVPDLIVIASYGGPGIDFAEVDVVRGLGGLEFEAPQRYRLDAPGGDLRYGDLDGDGLGDLALILQPSSIAVLRGVSGGRFRESPEIVPLPGDPRTIELLQLDGDGILDAVTGDASRQVFYRLENRSK